MTKFTISEGSVEDLKKEKRDGEGRRSSIPTDTVARDIAQRRADRDRDWARAVLRLGNRCLDCGRTGPVGIFCIVERSSCQNADYTSYLLGDTDLDGFCNGTELVCLVCAVLRFHKDVNPNSDRLKSAEEIAK